MAENSAAPGWPGITPRWTSSAKQGVGTAVNPASRVWFTLSHGIFNEIYYPRVDRACTRDMGMLVTGKGGSFSEEKRAAKSRVSYISAGVPAYRLLNTSDTGGYRIEKQIVTDPRREVVLQHTRFVSLAGAREDYRLFVLLAPHIGNHGGGNTGWVGDYKGVPMLFAEREGTCMALACTAPWLKRSVGFVGSSDGWQDISGNKEMRWEYQKAENGNIALTGQVDLEECDGQFTLALGFGGNAAEAGNRARASLSEGFEGLRDEYIREWREWLESLPSPDTRGPRPGSRKTGMGAAAGARSPAPGSVSDGCDLYAISAAMLRTHEAKNFPGGMIASLSIPWGFSKGDNDLGGYHLLWPRDLVESAGGLLAAGARDLAANVLRHLQSTQEPDGHWPQNMWLDGTPYWSGIQMDETAFPILLVDLLLREKAIKDEERARTWPMVKAAAGFLVTNGPVTQQDRWEEDPGYSPFTLAVEIAALLAAADLADSAGERGAASYFRETADAWNEGIERWTYVSGTDLARQVGVDGYYVRIAPPEVSEAASPAAGFVTIKNRPPGEGSSAAVHIVSPDALALVRFGLRAADDPRILNTVRVIDSLLKIETPRGPAWHRYNDDGYGEHPDGSPFDGTGTGRAWPLITGERAHYELAAGHTRAAEKLAAAMEASAGEGGLLPEQTWDAPDIPERGLFLGGPSGSAMPLLWAHAEFIKLRRSLADGRVFDMPPQTVARYQVEKRTTPFTIWRFSQKCRAMPAGGTLRVETLFPAIVQWRVGSTGTSRRQATRPTGMGVHVADLATREVPSGSDVDFSLARADGSGAADWTFCVHVI